MSRTIEHPRGCPHRAGDLCPFQIPARRIGRELTLAAELSIFRHLAETIPITNGNGSVLMQVKDTELA